jgi:Tfp pilus assembly protein PilN
MGKKGYKCEEEAAVASATAEIWALQAHIEKVEAMVQSQSLQLQAKLKFEMVTSQSRMQSEIKDQLDEFLDKFMRIHPGTPPPQAPITDIAPSNIG